MRALFTLTHSIFIFPLIPGIIIRHATWHDAELITSLSVTTFNDAYAAYNTPENMDKYVTEELSLAKLTGELADPGNVFFLVMDDDQAIGFAKLRHSYIPQKLKENNPIEIERFYILQTYQGRQIGAALMEHCITYARNQGFDIIWLGVWEYNPGAIAFYSRLGYEVFDSHIFGFGFEDQTDLMMKRTTQQL